MMLLYSKGGVSIESTLKGFWKRDAGMIILLRVLLYRLDFRFSRCSRSYKTLMVLDLVYSLAA